MAAIPHSALPQGRPSPSIVWSARALSGLCWLGIAVTIAVPAVTMMSWLTPEPAGAVADAPTVHFPDADSRFRFRLFMLTALVDNVIMVWVLLSARVSFVGVSRGDYFTRRTALGLRNMAIGVLFYMMLAPQIIELAQSLLVEGAHPFHIRADFSIPPALVFIFACATVLISSVIAHGARIADENRQFV